MRKVFVCLSLIFIFLGASVITGGDWIDGSSDVTFSNESEADVQDGVYATADWSNQDSQSAQLNSTSNLNAGIPGGSIIDSVFVGCVGKKAVGVLGDIRFFSAQINASATSNFVALPTSDGTREIGGSSANWDTFPTVSDVNSAEIFARFFYTAADLGTINIDYLYMRVVYHISGSTTKYHIIGYSQSHLHERIEQ